MEFNTIKDYWDWAHQTANISSLTGTQLSGHLQILGLMGQIKPGLSILCIGVGTGEWIKQTVEAVGLQGSVTALDISSTALAAVADIAKIYTPEQFYTANLNSKFDLAISVWVAPHMRKEQLREQLRAVIPALKFTGTFGIHYNEPFPGTSFDEDMLIQKFGSEANALSSGLFRMNREDFTEIVSDSGGYVKTRTIFREAKDYDEVLCAAHIKRQFNLPKK